MKNVFLLFCDFLKEVLVKLEYTEIVWLNINIKISKGRRGIFKQLNIS